MQDPLPRTAAAARPAAAQAPVIGGTAPEGVVAGAAEVDVDIALDALARRGAAAKATEAAAKVKAKAIQPTETEEAAGGATSSPTDVMEAVEPEPATPAKVMANGKAKAGPKAKATPTTVLNEPMKAVAPEASLSPAKAGEAKATVKGKALASWTADKCAPRSVGKKCPAVEASDST